MLKKYNKVILAGVCSLLFVNASAQVQQLSKAVPKILGENAVRVGANQFAVGVSKYTFIVSQDYVNRLEGMTELSVDRSLKTGRILSTDHFTTALKPKVIIIYDSPLKETTQEWGKYLYENYLSKVENVTDAGVAACYEKFKKERVEAMMREKGSVDWDDANLQAAWKEYVHTSVEPYLEEMGFSSTYVPERQGYVMMPETEEALKLWRQARSSLVPGESFVTSSLAPYRPKAEDPNALAPLPEEYTRDLNGAADLLCQYAGLRVQAAAGDDFVVDVLNGKTTWDKLPYLHSDAVGLSAFSPERGVADLSEISFIPGSQELKNSSFPSSYREIVPKVVQEDILTPKQALNKNLILSDREAGKYAAQTEQENIPYAMILRQNLKLSNVYPNGRTRGSTSQYHFADGETHLMVQLQLGDKLRWCEVELTPEGNFKVTPYK